MGPWVGKDAQHPVMLVQRMIICAGCPAGLLRAVVEDLSVSIRVRGPPGRDRCL